VSYAAAFITAVLHRRKCLPCFCEIRGGQFELAIRAAADVIHAEFSHAHESLFFFFKPIAGNLSNALNYWIFARPLAAAAGFMRRDASGGLFAAADVIFAIFTFQNINKHLILYTLADFI
jgi:hypothetical protein